MNLSVASLIGHIAVYKIISYLKWCNIHSPSVYH